MGVCAICKKERMVLKVARIDEAEVGICDACSYVIREEWNDIKMLRIQALDPKIAVTYVVIPRRFPSRSELDVTGYEFLTVSGGWPVTSYNPDKREMAKWLLDTHRIVTWPKGMTRIYAGFDASTRFAEVILLTLWGDHYDTNPKDPPRVWRGFSEMLSPETTKGAFVIGAKAGFEGFLLRRELAPAATTECTILSEPAVRYLSFKRGPESNSVWASKPMMEACFQMMSSKEKLIVGQLLGMTEEEPPPPAKVVSPAKPAAAPTNASEPQQSLDFDDSSPRTTTDDEPDDTVEYEDDGNGGMSAVRGPLEPEDNT
jgi:hypothetical protein